MLRAELATFSLPNQFGTKGFKPKTARWAIFGAEKAEKPGVEDASRRASRDAAVFREGIASRFREPNLVSPAANVALRPNKHRNYDTKPYRKSGACFLSVSLDL